jgi:hypothetical protein
LLLALTACVPSDPTPRPTGTSSSSATPEESDSASPTPTGEASNAATVVVTASAISVFGTDGSTLASVTYVMDAAAVATALADALGADPEVSTSEAYSDSCPSRTLYDFGGLTIGSPGGIGSAGFVGSGDRYDAYVSAPTTAGGVTIATVAGQQVGSTRAAFEAALGDEILLEQYIPNVAFGFDILNPEAGPYDYVGVQAWFDEDRLSAWSAPAAIGFVGDCE